MSLISFIIFSLLLSFCLAQKVPNCPSRTYTCGNGWRTLKDPNGVEFGYQAFIQQNITFYDADAFCRSRCAEVVSIHSQDEQDFVTRTARPLLNRCQFTTTCSQRAPQNGAAFDRMLRGFWIGMNRIIGTILTHNSTDNNVYCMWSDGSQCDFGAFPNGSVNANTNSPPWTRGNPNGVNTANAAIIEDCTQMVESQRGGWNDIPCNYRLGGVICKRQCDTYCAAQDI